jgi:hypothetical protein
MGAKRGALRVEVDGNGVDVVFERSANDAKSTEDNYGLAAFFVAVPPDDLLDRKGNVVLMWIAKPTADQKAKVNGCLS